jgi:ribosomal protein L7Ae-like RNA K-turn-binding protein
MQNSPILSRLGFARKAGKLLIGFEKSKEACQKGKARLIVVATDISAKTEKEIRYFGGEKVEVIKIAENLETLSAAIGVRAGVVALTDQGFADAVISLYKEDNQLC